MMTVDPAVLGGAVVGLVTLQLTSLGILLAVLRFFYRRLDRRFAEARTDIDRRFAEAFGAMQAGFAEARNDRRRIEEKLDEHGKEVARLQGIVERTYEPHRFTVGMVRLRTYAPADTACRTGRRIPAGGPGAGGTDRKAVDRQRWSRQRSGTDQGSTASGGGSESFLTSRSSCTNRKSEARTLQDRRQPQGVGFLSRSWRERAWAQADRLHQRAGASSASAPSGSRWPRSRGC